MKYLFFGFALPGLFLGGVLAHPSSLSPGEGVHIPHPDSLHVCCLQDLQCELMSSEEECLKQWGRWHPEWDSCDPNPCVDGICCSYHIEWGHCEIMPEEECLEQLGYWWPVNWGCEPNPCPSGPPWAVCCLEDGSCLLLDWGECLDAGGEWHPEFGNIPCDPNPCSPGGVEEREGIHATGLLTVVPNPFMHVTVLTYHLDQPGPLRIGIYDASGRLVRCLVSITAQAGFGSVEWDGRDDAGQRVGPGAYFCCLSTKDDVVSQLILLLE